MNLVGTSGNDSLVGGPDDDTLLGAAGSDTLAGAAGNDSLRGNEGTDWLDGGAGNDDVGGGSGQDSFVLRDIGTANADLLFDFASGWDDIQLDAAAFADIGATGRFSAGDARFRAGTAAQDADDRIIFNSATGQLFYDADGNGTGATQLIATLPSGRTVAASDLWVFGTPPAGDGVIRGTDGNDSLAGTAGDDSMEGLAGNDTLDGGAGADTMHGGLHDDLYIVDHWQDLVVELEGGGSNDEVQTSGTYTLPSWVNHLTLTGNQAVSALGNELDNRLTGNDAANFIVGYGGADTLIGGAGADEIQFSALPGLADADVIVGFASGEDRLTIDGRYHANSGASGNYVDGDGRFRLGASAQDADDRVLYDPATGQLWYDTDGSGAATAQLIATLQGAPTLVATDINILFGSGTTPGLHRVGTSDGDALTGGSGNDTLEGLEGNDTFYLGAATSAGYGHDLVEGGAGRDEIRWYNSSGPATAAPVSVDFAAGTLTGGGVSGGTGSAGFTSIESAVGSVFGDRLDASGVNYAVSLYGFEGDDTLLGGAGGDFLHGWVGDNHVSGGAGNDHIDAEEGNDALAGGDGNDTIYGNGGNDSLEGNAGDDVFFLNYRYDHDENGFPSGRIGFGNDSIDGGNGIDTIEARLVDFGLRVDLADGTLSDTSGRADASAQLSGIEAVVGSSREDLVRGNAAGNLLDGAEAADTLLGAGGNDTVIGGAGNDRLAGGAGNDSLTGDGGADSFVFSAAPTPGNADVITDFTSGLDRIELDGAAHTNLGATGAFSSGDARFWAAAGATAGHDADDRVIYNTATGDLYYDADGSGAGAAQRIATLAGAPALAARDIVAFDSAATGESLTGTAGDDTLVGGAGHDRLDGLAGSDSMRGDTGNDTLYGGGGNPGDVDSMDGGAGDDTYEVFVDSTSSVVITDAGGLDSVVARARSYELSLTLPAAIENLTLVPEHPALEPEPSGVGVTGIGNSLNNLITGAVDWWAGNTLDGADGNDTLIGGDAGDLFLFAAGSGNYGNDAVDGGAVNMRDDWISFYTVDGESYARSSVVIDFRDGTISGGGTGGSGGATFVRIENAVGSAFDDRLIANDGVDHNDPGGGYFGGPELRGGGGNDTLLGGASWDRLSGDATFGFDEALDYGADEIHGGDGGDEIAGGSGSDRLFGESGGDAFHMDAGAGAIGNDTIDGGAGTDIVRGYRWSAVTADLAAGYVTGGGIAGTEITTLISIEDFEGTAFGDRITGNSAGNRLTGLEGNDTLDGGAGNDTLQGGDPYSSTGSGADRYVFSVAPGSANADLVGRFSSGEDNIVLDGRAHAGSGPSGDFSAGDARWRVGSAAQDADDRVIYNTSTGQLWYDADGNGTGAAQLIATLEGAPALAATDISIVNGSGTTPPAGNTITGTSGNDSLTGTSGDDTFDGGAGTDTMNGMGGNDSYYVTAGDVIQDSGGNDTLFATTSTALPSAIENITYLGSANTASVGNSLSNAMTGNAGNNYMEGRGGNDTLTGGAGTDTLVGGAGNDVFRFVDATPDNLTDFASGTDKIVLDAAFFSNLGSAGDFAAGDARFRAGTAAQDADDRVIYNAATGQVWYDADGTGGGAAQVIATLTNRPALTATDIAVQGESSSSVIRGTEGNDSLTGTSGNDAMEGLAGNDTLNGGAGADTMDGGLHDDVYIVDNAGDVVIERDGGGSRDAIHSSVSYALSAFVNDLTLSGTAAVNGFGNELDNIIRGNAAGNFLAGGTGADLLEGGDGMDALVGGTGADTLIGGAGQDNFYMVEGSGNDYGHDVIDGGADHDNITFEGGPSAVVVDLGAFSVAGGGAGGSGSAFIENVEGVMGTPFADRIVGNASDNYFIGWDGGDTLEGAGGRDNLEGALGADLLIGGDGNDVLMADGRHPMHADGAADTLVGGLGNDQFYVSGEDVLSDEGGVDDVIVQESWTLGEDFENLFFGIGDFTGIGNGKDNNILAGSGRQRLEGLAGNDTLLGGEGDDTLLGGEGNDLLSAGFGADRLEGGAGNDRLVGLFDANTLVFAHRGAAHADLVEGFASGAHTIALDGAAFAEVGSGDFAPGDARFHAGAGANAGQDATDRVIYNTATGQLWYDADGSGAGAAQLIATLQDAAFLSAGDISVINGSSGGGAIGTNGDDSLVGTAGDDLLQGLAGNDTLRGLEGADTLDGGEGDDTYFVSGAEDVLVDAGGIDTVIGPRLGVMDAGIENLTIEGTWPEYLWPDVYGNELDNVIANATASFVMLDGRDGNDTLIGGSGPDRFFFSASSGNYGNDVVDGGTGGDDALDFQGAQSAVVIDFSARTVTGGGLGGTGSVAFTNIEQAIGSAYGDRLVADDSGVHLDGYYGNDTVIGGDGDDHLGGDSLWADHPATEEGGDDAIYGGAGNDWLYGDGGDDLIDGGAGDDVFRLASERGYDFGSDTLLGGDGIDTADSWAASGVADLAAGTFTHEFGVTTLSSIENFTADGGLVKMIGSAGANVLTGGYRDDTLDGAAGNDTLDGGAGGRDAFLFSAAPGAANADTVLRFASGEDKILLDSSAHAGAGALGDLASGDGRFRLGASAQDADDRVIYNTATGQLWYDADGNGAGTAQRVATLQGAPALAATDIGVYAGSYGAQIVGTSGNDSLRGGDGADHLLGLAGNDTLDGSFGPDSMEGGLHDDIYHVDSTGDVVVETEGGGSNDLVIASVSYTLPAWVNHLSLAEVQFVSGTGNELANLITGNGFHNVLNGREGDDTLLGGGTADDLSGDEGNDRLEGQAGNDALFGGAGNDSLLGGEGDDYFYFDGLGRDLIDGGSGTDQVTLGVGSGDVTVDLDARTIAIGATVLADITGIETVSGTQGADRMVGDAFANNLLGIDGDDTLDGGGGNDTLYGYTGADTYVFRTAPGDANADLVGGFESGSDKVVLDGNAHANAGASGNFAAGDGRFRASTSAQDADDRVIYNTSTGQLWYDADGNGGGTAQLIATLQGAPALAATDIAIVDGSGSTPPPSNVITGTSGPDTLVGTAGDDSYHVTPGDVIQDPGGTDQLFAETSFALPSAIEHITYLGTASTASAGNWQANAMTGNSGNNFLDGRDGNDTLYGAAGNDTLQGRTGADSFVFGEMGAANADSVTDFSSGTDRIAFDDSVFSGIEAAGSFRSGAGVSSGQDADDRVLYNTSTGQLYYDADGSGAGASQLVATLANAPGLAASDISLI